MRIQISIPEKYNTPLIKIKNKGNKKQKILKLILFGIHQNYYLGLWESSVDAKFQFMSDFFSL